MIIAIIIIIIIIIISSIMPKNGRPQVADGWFPYMESNCE
jgi:hypothetical protein